MRQSVFIAFLFWWLLVPSIVAGQEFDITPIQPHDLISSTPQSYDSPLILTSTVPACPCGHYPCHCASIEALDRAVRDAHKPLFFENYFGYLYDQSYVSWHLGDSLKQLHCGQFLTLDLGGQYRVRVHNERGMRNGLTGLNDDFEVWKPH